MRGSIIILALVTLSLLLLLSSPVVLVVYSQQQQQQQEHGSEPQPHHHDGQQSPGLDSRLPMQQLLQRHLAETLGIPSSAPYQQSDPRPPHLGLGSSHLDSQTMMHMNDLEALQTSQQQQQRFKMLYQKILDSEKGQMFATNQQQQQHPAVVAETAQPASPERAVTSMQMQQLPAQQMVPPQQQPQTQTSSSSSQVVNQQQQAPSQSQLQTQQHQQQQAPIQLHPQQQQQQLHPQQHEQKQVLLQISQLSTPPPAPVLLHQQASMPAIHYQVTTQPPNEPAQEIRVMQQQQPAASSAPPPQVVMTTTPAPPPPPLRTQSGSLSSAPYSSSYHQHSEVPLYLGHNPFIEILRPHSYADDNIVTLNLSHSHIYEIDSDAFVGQRFEHIDLSNNKLGLIHSRSFRIGPNHSRHSPYDPHMGNSSKGAGSVYPTRRPPPAHPKSVTIDFSHNPAIVALSGAFDHIDVPNCLLNFTNSTVELKFGAFKKYFKEHPGHIVDIESVDCCEQEWLLGYKHNFLYKTHCEHDPTLFLSKVSQQAIIDSCIAYVMSARHSMTIQGPSIIHQVAAAPKGHSNGHQDDKQYLTYLILGGTAMILTSLSIYIIFYMFSLKAAFVYQMQNKS